MTSPSRPVVLLSVLGSLLVTFSCGGRGADAPSAPPSEGPEVAADAAAGEEAEAPQTEPLGRTHVTIYFPSRASDGLLGEPREIFDTASPVDRAKQILSDLIAGPSGSQGLPALPPGTRVRQVYVLNDGLAYADFSSELRDGMTGGSDTELMAVYAIVNSLALNIPEIDRVGILVEGRPCETLNGHVDLSRPLPARLFLERVAVDGSVPVIPA